MKRSRWLLVAVAVFTPLFTGAAQTLDKQTEAEVLKAINSCATYLSEVVLDPQGKSRCDYQMLEGKWYDYEPPWHTGQVVYALVEAYRITKDERFLRAARRGGDWWVGLQIHDHAALNGMVRAIHGDGSDYIVFATVTDGTAGLFRLFDVTGEKRYADVPTSAGKWMLEHMYIPKERMFYDCVEPNTGNVMKTWSPFWPDKSEQTLFDVSRPNNEGSLFKDMFQYTGDDRYRKVFLDLCEGLIERQDQYGLWMDFVPNHKADSSVHPRFNLWYAESLLEGYALTNDRRFLLAAQKTARAHARFQQKDGTIYYTNYLDGTSNKNSICGSAVAFAGIVWLRLLEAGAGDEFKSNIQRSLKWLLKNRYATDHPDRNLAGGVLETRLRTRGGGLWLVNRDIATSFGVRFLCDYYNAATRHER
jgi:uncharacterized protein YyaL (SSP411 family)